MDCLVTKLKATVVDSEKKMEYFGGNIVTLLGQTANVITSVQVGNGVKAKFVDGDAHFVAGASDSTIIEDADGWITTTNTCYYMPSVATPVRVLIKPGTTVLNSSFSKFHDLNLNKLSLYVPKIIALTNGTAADMTLHFTSYPGCMADMMSFAINGHLDGEINLADLSAATKMYTFSVFSNEINPETWNIKGNLSSLGSIMALYDNKATIRLPKNKLTDRSIEHFAESFIVNRENGVKAQIQTANLAELTYNGQVVTNAVVTITVDSTAASGYTVTMI